MDEEEEGEEDNEEDADDDDDDEEEEDDEVEDDDDDDEVVVPPPPRPAVAHIAIGIGDVVRISDEATITRAWAAMNDVRRRRAQVAGLTHAANADIRKQTSKSMLVIGIRRGPQTLPPAQRENMYQPPN